MARKHVEGECHICGEYRKLSFEHVPPESAFNDRPILRAHIFKMVEENIRLNSPHGLKGKMQQRGAGGYTLCEDCNSKTGHWYGGAFADWARQGMELARGLDTSNLYHPFNIFPLRVIKQVVCMFFSVNAPGWGKVNPDLVRFVLNRDVRHLPSDVRLYAFYTISNRMRSSGLSGMITLEGGGSRSLFAEITFPPFGFVLTMGSSPPDGTLCDITAFAGCDYNDQLEMWLRMPIKPIYTYFPGDYRTEEQVIAQAGGG